MSEMRDNETRDTGLDERVLGAMRAPEVLAPDFESRLVAQARAEIARRQATTARRNWWVTGRVFVASPLAAFAMAAGIALAAAASTLVVTRRPKPAIIAKHDTVEFVRFVLVDSSARTVS